jgi:hypothetical protein
VDETARWRGDEKPTRGRGGKVDARDLKADHAKSRDFRKIHNINYLVHILTGLKQADSLTQLLHKLGILTLS